MARSCAKDGNYLTRLRDRILIADPGLVRLDMAGRTTAAVALTTVILLWIVGTSNGAQVLVLVGAISSWISAIPVNDLKVADRRRTTLLIPIPAIWRSQPPRPATFFARTSSF